MKSTTLAIPDMCCPTEQALVRKRLEGLEGVDELRFDTMSRELTVVHGLEDERRLIAEIETTGLHPVLKSRERAVLPTQPEKRLLWIRLATAGAAALASEVVAIATGNESSAPVIVLALLAIGIGGISTLRKGLAAIRSWTLNINFLMSIAIAGAIATGNWGEAAMVTVLFALAEEIESFSLDRARNAVRGLMEMTPESALLQTADGRWQTVPARSVGSGQILRVRPGERVPLDGQLISGRSSIDQASITGESIPVEKGPDDAVFAGTINQRGTFDFRVTGTSGHTTLDRIIETVQEAQTQRAPTQRLVDRFAAYYTPAVMGIAVLVAAIPPLFLGRPFEEWLYRALVLLVIACPCALVISTPITVVCGLAAAAKRGLLIKGGTYLEAGRQLRLIALDKTGTLTMGQPQVTDVRPFGETTEEDLLSVAASIEAHSEHPVASAILERQRLVGEPEPVADFDSIPGRGVRARLDGRLLYVGNHSLVHELRVCRPEVEEALESLEDQGKTVVAVFDETRVLGLIAVADSLRPHSSEAVQQLHDLGIRTALLTGDNEKTAAAIAREAGIDDARGGLMPEEKLRAVEEYVRQHGVVGMAGDGVNDAPALAKASIGFAMGAAGTDTALETADVALMDDDLRGLPEFVRISRRTCRILAQNITFAIGIKVLFLGLAMAGEATLWMAVFADMGASLLVVFNGLRLLPRR